MGAAPNERSKEMALRQTAAARVVEIDFQIPALIADLSGANEGFEQAVNAKSAAQAEYDSAKSNLDHEKQLATDGIVSNSYANNPKVTQAEIDRKCKSEFNDNPVIQKAQALVDTAKETLDAAVAEYEAARIHHRTLVAQLNAASAALNFMTASKTARAIALQNLSDL